MASKAAKTSGVETAMSGRHEHDAGRAVETVERRDVFAAPLDERRAAGEEERHVGAEVGGDDVACVLVQFGAPCLERAVEGGRRVR